MRPATPRPRQGSFLGSPAKSSSGPLLLPPAVRGRLPVVSSQASSPAPSPARSPTPPLGRIRGRQLIGRGPEREPKTLLRGDAASELSREPPGEKLGCSAGFDSRVEASLTPRHSNSTGALGAIHARRLPEAAGTLTVHGLGDHSSRRPFFAHMHCTKDTETLSSA